MSCFDAIKITDDLKIDFRDLNRKIDFDHSFTLRDILRACTVNCEISKEIMAELFHCAYIWDYWDEARSKEFKNDGNIEWLELALFMEADSDYSFRKKKKNGVKRAFRTYTYWQFNGVGRAGTAGDDVNKYLKEKGIDPDTYRESYSIEFAPIYNIADLKVKIREKITSIDWDIDYKKDPDLLNTDFDFRPSIRVSDLLYEIFWDLSFSGSIKDRDEKLEMINERVKNIKENKSARKTYKSAEDLFNSIERECKSGRMRRRTNKNKVAKDKRFRKGK